MPANDSKSYLNCLNILAGWYYTNYNYSIDKESINADYSALIEETESSHHAPKVEVGNTVKINTHKNIFSKGYKISQEKYLWLILCWKLIYWHIKSKI